MYYRRKVILSFLQVLDNEVDKIKLQKLLFLYSRNTTKRKTFDFVPYKYGCYSFQANADLKTLGKYGIVSNHDTFWRKEDSTNYLNQLSKEDQKTVKDFKIIYADKTSADLINLTYKNFPYYSINSTIASEYLTDLELNNLERYRSYEDETVLFTIGYEGISLEKYLNKLIKNNINTLCDVRRNAQSMKYGFNKSQLKNACNGLGIEYIHIPEVGIESDKRQELVDQEDYDKLFDNYKKTNLTLTKNFQLDILKLLQKKKRIALTCFEADECQCHRLHLAEAITELPNFKYSLEHL